MQHHQYNLTELSDMLPWEREVYTKMLQDHIHEQNEKARQRANRLKK